MDNEPPPVTPFVYKGIPRLHRFGGAWRLTREEERVGSDIGGYVAPDPDCTGIDDAARVAFEEMDKIVLDCSGVGPRAIRDCWEQDRVGSVVRRHLVRIMRCEGLVPTVKQSRDLRGSGLHASHR